MASLSKSAGFLPAILITGASSGIGRQLSLEVAARNSKGCAIILTARRLQLLKELQSELQQKFKNVHVFLYALDVTDFNKTFELLDVILPRELHPLDFRLNSVYLNAGIAEISQPVGHYYDPSSGKTPAPGSSWAKILAASGIKHPEEDDGRAHFNYQKSILETNVLGLMAVTHAAMRYFIRFNVPGHLIGMSSQAGLRGLPGSSSYCTSKIAVTRFLETIGMELLSQPDNKIKVTVLNLGYIDTPLNRSVPVRPFGELKMV